MVVVWVVIALIAAFLVTLLVLPTSGLYAFPVLIALAIVGYVIFAAASRASREDTSGPREDQPDMSQGFRGDPH